MVEDVKALSCTVAHIETLACGKIVEVGVAQLHALHLFEFGVVGTLVGMGLLQYLQRVSARYKGLVVVRACLVFGVAVPLAEVSAHNVVYLHHRELRVDDG